MEICRASQPNQDAVADLGGVGQLVVLMKNGSDEVRTEAAGAIWTLSEGNPANKVSIASAGGIPPLVQLLATGDERGIGHAKRALAALGLENVDNQAQITALLVGLLGSGTIAAMSSAAASLWQLVQENRTSQGKIAHAGSTEDKIILLRKGCGEAREFALWSLSLSIDAESQPIVLGEGGTEPLVAMLQAPNAASREQAGAALHRLALNCPDAQAQVAAAGPLVLSGLSIRPAAAAMPAARAKSRLAAITWRRPAVEIHWGMACMGISPGSLKA